MAHEDDVPGTEDWMWVLQRPCPQCGTDVREHTPVTIAPLVAAAVPRWQVVLRRDDVRQRPSPGTWSPLEYAAHLRDVCAVFAQRLQLMLRKTEPSFSSWDPDVAAARGAYAELDPATVAQQLWQGASELAAAFESLPPGTWQRSGTRGDGAVFTITTLAQYFAHEVCHHLHDVGG